MSPLNHAGMQKVVAALTEAGHDRSAAGVRVLDDDVRTAADAAAALGVPVGAIANSLVFTAVLDGVERPLLALTSGRHRADTTRLAELVGATEVGKASPAFVRTHTGQVIGGVAPVGHPEPIRTLVDTALADHPVVWAAAGHPKSVFPTTFADLVDLTGGTPAWLADQPEPAAPSRPAPAGSPDQAPRPASDTPS
ncbi:YbaK/EbsC family protein [Goodfellowiella coeruleoviolacea]|uniref:Cys-tRNA(Pro) deacylase, prolyl-tRNA editing enzyme YbaK/EbsC n=1 Tax=Goodfellowiella coeruleoviolacea TaxID=334858 RepID=A0AAE3GDM0_9PSEU|nr:YbaK/EbsC family protein [Goodfellowiella coeruleoviolacea]MCP2165342.1 Cys-tRNA(Pro) deacylase, prolyl-tRNA editing enzyme YbaK/EbsC [Goodfellowiella coeruleoviolacea]